LDAHAVAFARILCIVLTLSPRFLKYFRLVINCIAFWCYKPVPLSDEPKFTPDDVTAVIPTLDGDTDELRETVRSVLTNDPHRVILVTIDANIEKAKAAFSGMSKKIDIYSIPKANKRRQLCKALPLITTEITILADDDVSWPPNLLSWMLSPFEDERMGGVGTNQRLRREAKPNIWNWLGAAYLIRRNWDCTACEFMDGGLPCLSGRTVAYRTHIIRDPDFIHSFTHETWQSCQLNADDDNFLTRWMVNHGWKTWIQYHRDCEVETTLEDNSKYLLQCLRWARSNWRSNLKSLFVEWTVWRYVKLQWSYRIDQALPIGTKANPQEFRRHPWSTFAVFQTTLSSWALLYDASMLWLFWQVSLPLNHDVRQASRLLFGFWVVLLCRIIKYMGHFTRYPEDLKYILLIPLFGYFHSCFIKIYAMLTMHIVSVSHECTLFRVADTRVLDHLGQ
jgi:cellulose synthase/poly-beta-1,6-N-acetylglucosamine synthase-like glycosyltransferase